MTCESIKPEKTCDILYGELRMIQPDEGEGPRVNVDTVLLADFARVPARAKIIEMGCAHGAVSLIIARRRKIEFAGRKTPPMDAFDINGELIETARKNASINELSDDVNFFACNLREIKKFREAEGYDAVVMNPPYDEIDRSRPNESAAMATAMHGAECTLRDVAAAAKYLLKNGGKFFLVMRAKRVAELFSILGEFNVKPKRMRSVHPKPDRDASVVLVEAVRASGDGLIVEPPLFIHGEDGEYTPRLLDAYRLRDE